MLVVSNAQSRRGAAVAERVRPVLEAAGGTRWVALADLRDDVPVAGRVVVIGGDGTVSAVVAWLHRRDTTAELAIIPAGTGNNLASGLGLALEPLAAAEVAVSGTRCRQIDIVACQLLDDQHTVLIIQSAAFAFPACVAAAYDRLRTHRALRLIARPFGTYIYRVLAAIGLLREQVGVGLTAETVTVTLPGGDQVTSPVIALFVGNDSSLGGNFLPCPRAEIDDGRLDLCLIAAGASCHYLRLFREVARGTHLTDAAVQYWQHPGTVRLTFSEPTKLVADGEIVPAGREFELSVLPGALSILTG
jgi:diacylglycerol kinase (ATP)